MIEEGHVSAQDKEIGFEPRKLRRAAKPPAGCDVDRVPKFRHAPSHPLLRAGIHLSVGMVLVEHFGRVACR